MRFPKIENDYIQSLADFEAGASRYGSANDGVYWELIDGKPVHVGVDRSKIDRNFFDWRKIELVYRAAVANYYVKNYPAYEVSSDAEVLQEFFCAGEFKLFLATDVTEVKSDQNIHNFSLGAWPSFRDALITNSETEAAHLASVIFESTKLDWKPVGTRSLKDPLEYLRGLQAGNAVRRHANFSLYRLQG